MATPESASHHDETPAIALTPASNPNPVIKSQRLDLWIGLAVLVFVLGTSAGALATYLLVSAPKEVAKEKSKTPSPSEEGEVTLSLDKQSASRVVVQAITAESLVSRTWRPGRVAVHDDQIAHIYPPTEGVVRDVPVKLGHTVAAGDTLAVLESREFGQAKLETYKARIALAAERELAERMRTTMRNAEELLKLLVDETPLAEIEKRMTDKPIGDWRQQLLGAYVRRNQLKSLLAAQSSLAGTVSEANLRKTQADTESAVATYTSLLEELRFQAKNQVRQAELKLKDAETTYDVSKAKLLLYGLTADQIDKLNPIAEGAAVSHLLIKAPFTGVVVEKHAVPSERVGPTLQMFVVADLSKVWIQADVFEADLPLVRKMKGHTVSYRSTVSDIAEGTAKVVYAGDLLDKSTRSLTVTAEAANPDRKLKPGMFIEVGFDTGEASDILQVPTGAILRHENKPFVFVQVKEDLFRKVDVELGRSSGDKVEILTGIKPGDKVVVRAVAGTTAELLIASGIKAGDKVVVSGGFTLKSEMLKDQMVGE